MKLEKAIEILEVEKGSASLQDDKEFYKALDLGIEAMKEVNALRKVLLGLGNSLLPGETAE